MDKQIFINSVKGGALIGQAESNILPSLTIAQAILESAWGSSKLCVAANNIFGIKAFSDWNGRKITLPTSEWFNGKMQIVDADFRAYNSFYDSIEDHNRLLSGARYKSVCECGDYKSACQAIFQCGYATDPNYPGKLVQIIEQNRLYEFDSASIESDKIRRFQKLCNALHIRDSEGNALAEDNILGAKTRSCISKMPILKMGSQAIAVKFIQEVVGAEPVDGIFGTITKQSVMAYQRNRNLAADGIVGSKTWFCIVTT